MQPKELTRINELARKAREEGLSEAEVAEQKQLRTAYIAAYRQNLKATLDQIVLVDEEGHKTPLKPKK